MTDRDGEASCGHGREPKKIRKIFKNILTGGLAYIIITLALCECATGNQRGVAQLG